MTILPSTPELQKPDEHSHCAVSPGWAPCLSFYNAFLREGVSPITVRDYLPEDIIRIVVLHAMGWWIGNNWRSIRGGCTVSFHGPKGEMRPDAPAEVLAMTRKQMVDFLLPNTRAQAVPCESSSPNPGNK